MKFSDLPHGQYKAQLKDYGLEEVAKMNGKIKVVLQFDVDASGEWVSGRWEGFLENKDDTPNKYTLKTLLTCGFNGVDIGDLTKPNALDLTKDYSVTVERIGEYNKIKWVNIPGQTFGIKKMTTAPKSSLKLKAAFSDLKKEMGIETKKIKNYAPGAEDELPF